MTRHKQTSKTRPLSTARQVLEVVLSNSDRVFTQENFAHLPRTGVSLALSRLTRQGLLTRVSRGVYYRSRDTVLGKSKPRQSSIEQSLLSGARPTGLTAAAMLGFSTQQPAKPSFAVPNRNEITRLRNVKIVRMRPDHDLTLEEGAILEFIRDRGRWSELDDDETIKRLKKLVADPERFDRISAAAMNEPPRVRAILGALGSASKAKGGTIEKLRNSLNPTSKFDFGKLGALPSAKEWRAK